MESQISTPQDFKWSCDGPGSLCLISHRLALLPPLVFHLEVEQRCRRLPGMCGRTEESSASTQQLLGETGDKSGRDGESDD